MKQTPDEEDLAIRFVNTVAWRLRVPAEERLGCPEELLAWLKDNRVGEPAQLRALARAWRKRPADAASFHETAIRLRETIHALLAARIRGTRPVRGALTFFSEYLSREDRAVDLAWERGTFVWRGTDPLSLLDPIALSAAELISGPRAGRVRQCQDDRGCGWLFVDDSRAQNRRWCSMGDCGNRAKARRHYARVRQKVRRAGSRR